MTILNTFAPAKINLYLHITGKRKDGYHLLDSLVAFTDIGDEIRLEPAEEFSFALEGPMATALKDEPVEGNLAVKAAKALAAALNKPLHMKMTLTKNLPIASGIGGGSSDAAAALRLLARYWGVAPDAPELYTIAASLGSDVPCCLPCATCYFRDTGNVTDPGPALPPIYIVLVNPKKSLPTPAVYKAREGAFAPAQRLEKTALSAEELAEMLRLRGNSLTDAACRLMPEIGVILEALAATRDCLLARMSGSGATCFGLYASFSAAESAASTLRKTHPGWWVSQGLVPFAPSGSSL
ncbi:MAG: 4-(cytidine 5'-diphospho)-2-C-methyl-D-erythritol kinase [Alphaproteobacteria bacterium]|nr:4-(cytidine 5'-diphospho)-2-C-methyl-D-erythritol kinase [Alphaproteobacteria bacterium]